MKSDRFPLTLLAVLLITASSAPVLAMPLGVKPVNGASQQVIMCPKCGMPIACVTAGNYTLAFTAELLDPISLRRVRLTVRVADKAGAPVNDARVQSGCG